jgi:pimeloyl-ACP methyl ester carboxylesterase
MAATDRALSPFLAGLVAGAAAAVLTRAIVRPRRTFDPRLLRRKRSDVTPVVLVPGVLGSGLHRPDGTQVWLSMQNALRHHDLQLPLRLPLTDSRDELVPGALLGTRALMPRLFGFTEYAELVEVLEQAGFRERKRAPRYHVFAYDWRRDVVEAARNLGATLDALAEARGEPDARFSMIGHSMGGLVARYYLRYGTAEPGGPVTWAGARRIRTLVLAVSPNGGSIPALEAILTGERVGLSTTTLAPEVIARMPSMYQLMPPAGTHPLLSPKLEPLSDDLHDVATWQRHGWGPYAPGFASPELELEREYLATVLARARELHDALARPVESPCPIPVLLLGGDCLPTLARAVVGERPGPPRFEAITDADAEAMFEAGDGRVTRASVLAAHLPSDPVTEAGMPEVTRAVFGSADHHGIYGEPTFQSLLVRALLRV